MWLESTEAQRAYWIILKSCWRMWSSGLSSCLKAKEEQINSEMFIFKLNKKCNNKSIFVSGLFKPHCRKVCFHLSCSFLYFSVFVLRANVSFVEAIWFLSTALVAPELTIPNLTPYSWTVCIFVSVRGEEEMSSCHWYYVTESARKKALSEDRPLCDRFSLIKGTASVPVHVMCLGKKRGRIKRL